MKISIDTRPYKYDDDYIIIYYNNIKIYSGLYEDFEERELYELKNKIKAINKSYVFKFDDYDLGYKILDEMKWDNAISGYRFNDLTLVILDI